MRALALPLALFLLACGGDKELDLDGFMSQYPEAYCAYLQRCCDAAERSYAATASCQQATAETLKELFAFRDSTTPHASFSATAARGCLERLRSASCKNEPQLAAGCAESTVTAQQKDGDECTYSVECRSYYCVQPQKNVKGSCGTGSSSCSGDDRGCPAGAYCNGLRQCVPKVENAKPCTRPGECQSGICGTAPSGKICVARPDPWCDG